MFRKENGVTLVALVITIIVLLILAGVTISMVLGDDGIISQAFGANTAQNRANVSDQANVAYATVRAEGVARQAGISANGTTDVGNYAAAIAIEMAKTGAFESENIVYKNDDSICVKVKGTKDYEYFVITISDDNTITAVSVGSSTDFSDGTTASVSATY